MSDRIRIHANAIPIEDLTTEDGDTDSRIASEVGTPIAGWCETDIANYGRAAAVQGYKDKAPYYVQVDDSIPGPVTTETVAKVVIFRNTGKTYVSSSVLGEPLDKSIKIFFDSTIVALLPAGGVWYTMNVAGINVYSLFELSTCDNDGSNNASAGHLALEMLVVK